MLNLANPYGTVIGKAVGGNTRKMGPRGPSGVRAHQGCGHTPTGPKWPHLRWVASVGPLGGSCKVLRHLKLIWYEFWPFLSTWLGPDFPSLLGLFLLGSCQVMLCLVLCVLLTHFLCYPDISFCNWWITKTHGTLLVMSPISKFGVHLDGFYINVGS
jgi:hypothetical protein